MPQAPPSVRSRRATPEHPRGAAAARAGSLLLLLCVLAPLQALRFHPAADMVMLDTYSIHEGVDAARFDSERVLELVPPDGHFALMNYRWVAGCVLR
mgnify:CR=1 FL=1